jgi:calcium/calmodulin-dependent protein kinase I
MDALMEEEEEEKQAQEESAAGVGAAGFLQESRGVGGGGCFPFFSSMLAGSSGTNDASTMILAQPGATLKGGVFADKKGKTKYKLEDLYTLDARLRSGSYGTVYKCYHKNSKATTSTINSSTTTTTTTTASSSSSSPYCYAVKIMDRTKLKKVDDDGVFREVSILAELVQHEHVIRLVDFFVEPQRLCVVQVLAVGGDVFDRLATRQVYTEHDARHLARILLEAVAGLHSVQPCPIIHRDLKPENLLLKDEIDDYSILLADFGFARHVPAATADDVEGGCKTRCGTPAYVAPEIILGLPYKTSVDLWSIGCLIYMLIGGYPPFSGKDHRELFRKVRAGDFVFHEAHFGQVSVEAKTVITNLLTVTVDKRCTAKEALASDWFTKKKLDSELSERDLSGTIDEIKSFNARRKWKVAKNVIKWASNQPFWKPDAISFSQQLSEWDKELLKAKQQDQQGSSIISSAPLVIKFADAYDLGTKLRAGSYATVWQCAHKHTKEVFAVKIIERRGLRPSDDETVLNEVAIMRKFFTGLYICTMPLFGQFFSHSHFGILRAESLSGNKYVVQLMDFYEEEDRFYLVMEYVSGGDVFDRIVKMTQYTERDARDLTVKLLKAVNSMHKLGIAVSVVMIMLHGP